MTTPSDTAWRRIERAAEALKKQHPELSQAQAIDRAVQADPKLYDDYLFAGRPGYVPQSEAAKAERAAIEASVAAWQRRKAAQAATTAKKVTTAPARTTATARTTTKSTAACHICGQVRPHMLKTLVDDRLTPICVKCSARR